MSATIRRVLAPAVALAIGVIQSAALAQTARPVGPQGQYQAPGAGAPSPAPAVTTLGGSIPSLGGRRAGLPLPRAAGAARPVAAVAHGSGEHGSAAHGGHCPGHGPTDPPPHVNWYQGLIGVNNDKAISGSALEKLLYRYENSNDPCDSKNQAPPFLAQLINFGLLALILVKFGRKPIAAALAKRRETMMADIENAARLKTEAETRLQEFETKFAAMGETLATAKSDYAAAAENEKRRVLDDAEALRRRMRRDAEFRIEQEIKAVRNSLLREATEAAVQRAEELLTAQVTPVDQARMAEEYVRILSQATAADGSRVGGAA